MSPQFQRPVGLPGYQVRQEVESKQNEFRLQLEVFPGMSDEVSNGSASPHQRMLSSALKRGDENGDRTANMLNRLDDVVSNDSGERGYLPKFRHKPRQRPPLSQRFIKDPDLKDKLRILKTL